MNVIEIQSIEDKLGQRLSEIRYSVCCPLSSPVESVVSCVDILAVVGL